MTDSVNALHCAYHSLLVWTAQIVGFEQTSFTVLEGESVEVCITLSGDVTGPGPFDFNIFALFLPGEIVSTLNSEFWYWIVGTTSCEPNTSLLLNLGYELWYQITGDPKSPLVQAQFSHLEFSDG